jgi:glycine hydroxymethyltransferase
LKNRLSKLKVSDPVLFDICERELKREREGLEMIASESFVPIEILELQGSVLTNKTAEGYPGLRYHAGCGVLDEMETLGIERAKLLFGAEHANIQPLSGSSANQAVYFSVLEAGDTVLGMRLDQGGHLTHGYPMNFSGKTYHFIEYGVHPDTETLDYDSVERLAIEHRPKMIVAGASAYPRTIDYERLGKIAKSVGAYFFVDMAHVAGLIAAGVLPSPVPHADFVTSTTTKTLAGARGGFILCRGEFAKAIDRAVFPGVQGSMHMHVMAAKTFSFGRAMTEAFKDYGRRVVENAKALGEALENHGFRLVSGGTDNHMLLVDLRPKGITGKKFEKLLEQVGITVNKNMIPFDPEKPMVTSGVRVGVTAMTIKGMGPGEMALIADMMRRVAEYPEDPDIQAQISDEVIRLAKSFPLYEGYFE